MLVLSRKAGEKIIISGSIEITVVALERGKVRIGIVAPPDVTVHRKEVFDRILEFAEPQAPAAHRETVPS